MIKERLCFSDEKHWCVECCFRSGGGCYLLGTLSDGRKGCLGHNGKIFDGITQTLGCQNFDCLSPKLVEMRDEIARAIKNLPPGEFKMSKVLIEVKERRVMEVSV